LSLVLLLEGFDFVISLISNIANENEDHQKDEEYYGRRLRNRLKWLWAVVMVS
jgi:hypothetical protein